MSQALDSSTNSGSQGAGVAANDNSRNAAVQNQINQLEMLREHIQENFGESLAPILERVIFQRGWQNNDLDEFYTNLSNNAPTIIAECRRNITEQELVMSIEENLLRALFMGHGQNAVQMVQALRYCSLEDRFLAMVDPSALAKLLDSLSNPQPQQGGRAAGTPTNGSNSRQNSYPNTPHSNGGGNYGGQNGNGIPRDTNYPQQPQGSPNHRVQPPANGYGNGAQSSSYGGPNTGNTGNSWGIGGGSQQQQQLSPYPNNRNQPNSYNSGSSNNNNSNSNQQNGPQFPQANSYDGSETQSPSNGRRNGPAPSAPAPLFGLDGEGPPNAIGSTPTSYQSQEHDEEYRRQVQERNEAELEAWLAERDHSHMFNALKAKWSLQRLRELSPKVFESELKRLICSKSARNGLLDLLHPDGIFPEEPPEGQESPALANSSTNRTPPEQHHAPRYGKDVASTNAILDTLKLSPEKSNGSRHNSNNMNMSNSGNGTTRRGAPPAPAAYDDHQYHQQQQMQMSNSRTSMRQSNSSMSMSMSGTTNTSPTGTGQHQGASLNSMLFYDDDPAYQHEQQQQQAQAQQQKQQHGGRNGANNANNKGGRNNSGPQQDGPSTRERRNPKHHDQDGPNGAYPNKRGDHEGEREQGGRRKPVTSLLILRGVQGLNMDLVSQSVGRLGTVVSFKLSGREEDEASFVLSNVKEEISQTRTISIRQNQQQHKIRIHKFLRGSQEKRDGPPGTPDKSIPCRYFNGPVGCNRGNDCMYEHVKVDMPRHKGKKNAQQQQRQQDGEHHQHQQHNGEQHHQHQHQQQQRGPKGPRGGMPPPPPPPHHDGSNGVTPSDSQHDLTGEQMPDQHHHHHNHHHGHHNQHGGYQQQPQQNGAGGYNNSRHGSSSNLTSPQKKLSTPIDEIPKPRSFQQAMANGGSGHSSPMPGGSPVAQGYPSYNQAPPPHHHQHNPHQPQYGGYGNDQQYGGGMSTPHYEEAQHHTVPSPHAPSSPVNQQPPQFHEAQQHVVEAPAQ